MHEWAIADLEQDRKVGKRRRTEQAGPAGPAAPEPSPSAAAPAAPAAPTATPTPAAQAKLPDAVSGDLSRPMTFVRASEPYAPYQPSPTTPAAPAPTPAAPAATNPAVGDNQAAAAAAARAAKIEAAALEIESRLFAEANALTDQNRQDIKAFLRGNRSTPCFCAEMCNAEARACADVGRQRSSGCARHRPAAERAGGARDRPERARAAGRAAGLGDRRVAHLPDQLHERPVEEGAAAAGARCRRARAARAARTVPAEPQWAEGAQVARRPS